MKNDRDQVKDMLRDRIEDLCRALLPETDRLCGRKGRLWVSYNPVRNDYDASTPELKVGLTGDIGAWKDWRSGDKGDVIGLIEYVRRESFREAMVFARHFLGLSSMTPAERKAEEARSRERSRERAAEAERIRLWKIGEAERKFLTGTIYGAHTAAETHARHYFGCRRCWLEDVASLDEATFRFHHASEYWTGAEYRTGDNGRRWKVKDGPAFPAIHSAMRAPTGQVVACHVTFLDPVLPKKVALGSKIPAKLIFGEAKGAVIRISHGPEGEPPEMARQASPLILCEGIETGLSLAGAIPEARVWAAGSLSNMANAPVFLDCVGPVIVARDNNFGNDQAQKQLDDALAALAAHGKPIEVIASHVGDDFNDLAKGEE